MSTSKQKPLRNRTFFTAAAIGEWETDNGNPVEGSGGNLCQRLFDTGQIVVWFEPDEYWMEEEILVIRWSCIYENGSYRPDEKPTMDDAIQGRIDSGEVVFP